MGVQTCNLSAEEAEVGILVWVLDQSELHRESEAGLA